MPDVTFPLVPRGRIVGLAFGSMESARRGTGTDIAGSRPYTIGDDVDRIDWRTSARLSSASDRDEFVVRQYYADEAPRVVVVADRRPEMTLFPPQLPWLQKPAAQRIAIEFILESAADAHGFVGYVDYAGGGDEPFWLPPQSQSVWEYEEREQEGARFEAPPENVERAFEFLVAHPRAVPAGTFVFVLSDFLVPPSREVLLHALEQRWDVVPVVLQDPTWERSFPPIESFHVPLADVAGDVRVVRLRRGEVEARRREHERRWAELHEDFASLGMRPVVIGAADRGHVLEEFLAWSEERRSDGGGGW